MRLQDPNFDKRAYFKKLETFVYLLFMVPLIFFGWAFLETQDRGGLRSVIFEEPDLIFHTVMGVAIAYVLMRTLGTWKRDVRRALERVPYLDVKLQMLQKPILYRNLLWSMGAAVGAYGIYDKGDMVYAMVFVLFLILITSNRPTGRYFANLLELKGEERTWMEDRKIP